MIVIRQFIGVLCFSLLAGITYSQSIVQVIPLPGTTYWNQAWGAFADSTHLYMSSGTTTAVFNRGHIYKLDFNGNVVDSVVTGLNSSQGLAWDGTHYWYLRGSGSTGRIYRVSTAGALVDSIIPPSTTWFLGGACWDGTGLWVSLYSPNVQAGLYKYDVVTKTIIDTIPTIGQQPQGIAWDGQYLYYAMDLNSTEPNLNLIYVVNPVTGDTVRTISMPDSPTTDSNPRGLAWDGDYLWLVAEPVGASSGRALYKYDLGGSGTPDINLGMSLVNFGGVRIGQQSQIIVDLQNVGTAPLTIDSVVVALSGNIIASLATPVIVGAGSSEPLPLTFSPVVYGPDTASVRVYSSDPDEGLKILPARGFGMQPGPYLNAPGSQAFGVRRVSSSNVWSLVIRNQGPTPLNITSATFGTSNFSVAPGSFPVSIDSLASVTVRVWFNPTSAVAFADTMRITSNASNGPVTPIALSGIGDNTPLALGTSFWTTTVPLHPSSNTTRRVRAVRSINDVTGDGKADVIVSTDNYWTMAFNGNSSVDNDSVWGFSTYKGNTSAGPIGSEGDYSYQKAIGIASDLNGDGFNDVVIGTGGGNEHVYAISGRTGQMLWTFGTDHPDSFSLGDISGVDVSTDFNSDGTPDVVAAGSATQTGGVGGRRSAYLFNGANGNILWQSPLPGFTHAVTAIADISGDGVPDVIGTAGEPSYKASAFSGANGAILWDYTVASSTGGGKEVIALPLQSQTPDVILGAFWGPVFRLDGETGTMVWQRPTNGRDPTRLMRLRDINSDGIDEIVLSLLVGDAWCLDGATGNILWSYPANSGMDITVCPDLNNDGYDEVVVASQNEDVLILRGNNGQLLFQYPFAGSEQARSVAPLADLDGNGSFEIVAGSDLSRVVLISGGLDASVSVGGSGELPGEFILSQNYPNPFNPTTTIELSLPVQSDFSLTIFDILGREVRTYSYERVPAGVHKIVWDGTNGRGTPVASGVYLYRVRSGEKSLTRRMMVLK